MHLCMKRSSPQASMPVSFSFPFQFKALVQERTESVMADNFKIPEETVVDVLAI